MDRHRHSLAAGDPSSLFRPEALEQRQLQSLGRVVVASPPLLRLGAATSLVIALLLGSLVTFGQYAPRQNVSGFLMPQRGLVKVFGARAGKADVVQVRDGQQVKFGQALVLVSAEQGLMDSEGKSAVAHILAELDQQERRLSENLGRDVETAKASESQLQVRTKSLRLELESVKAQRAALERQKTNAETVQARMQKLHEAGSFPEVELMVRQQQILELERQWHALTQSIVTAESQLKDATHELTQQPAQVKQRKAELENRISEIRRQIAGYEIERGYAIKAPIAGRVTALQIEPGMPVTPAQPIMAIVADDAVMEAHLLVPSRAIGFVAKGQEVRLRYAAFPYQHYGVYSARVTEISRTTLRQEDLAVGLPLPEPVYRVKAKLDAQTVRARGKKHALQAGMLLEADILLEERPLWAWFVEPLLAFRGRT